MVPQQEYWSHPGSSRAIEEWPDGTNNVHCKVGRILNVINTHVFTVVNAHGIINVPDIRSALLRILKEMEAQGSPGAPPRGRLERDIQKDLQKLLR